MDAETASFPPLDATPFHAVPSAPGHAQRHAITTHLPSWKMILEFGEPKPEFFAQFVDFYPRVLLHKDVKQFIGAVVEHARAEGQSCFPFPSLEAATACRDFVTAAKRPDGMDSLSPDEVLIRAFDLHTRVHCVFFPKEKAGLVARFWTHPGVGISSRFAEDALEHINRIREAKEGDMPPKVDSSPAYPALRSRIAELLERSPINSHRKNRVSAEDVYLYQTGMASIYYVHQYLLKWRNAKTVLFGFAFQSTIHIFEWFGPGLQFFPLGTELEDLEKFLQSESAAGKPVQAVWTEFPSNPLLVSSDLARLRVLADKYHFALVVDETISGFCNVDLLGVADILATSLTKAFNGYADVMAGSAVLNPSSPLYAELSPLFDGNYHNDLYSRDAEILLQNNQDYLQRCQILDNNATVLVNYLQSLTIDPKSSVSRVHYPSVSPTRSNYDAYKRPATPDFKPGYGCLFSMEFDSLESVIAFYDNIPLHCGPHLGAHRTLALPYTKAIYAKELEKVAAYGLKETQIRISTGLEDSQELLAKLKYAVAKADAAKEKLQLT